MSLLSYLSHISAPYISIWKDLLNLSTREGVQKGAYCKGKVKQLSCYGTSVVDGKRYTLDKNGSVRKLGQSVPIVGGGKEVYIERIRNKKKRRQANLLRKLQTIVEYSS